MGRYCTTDQYHSVSHSIHCWGQGAGHEALKKLLLIAMSILNHADKSDKKLHIIGNLPANPPNYGDCLQKLQSLYDNPDVTYEDVQPVIHYVDSYVALKSGVVPKPPQKHTARESLLLVTKLLDSLLLYIAHIPVKPRTQMKFYFSKENIDTISSKVAEIIEEIQKGYFSELSIPTLRIQTKLGSIIYDLVPENSDSKVGTMLSREVYMEILYDVKRCLDLVSLPSLKGKNHHE